MTEFTTWRSLVDGEEISAIPDILVDNFELEDSDPLGVWKDGETPNDRYPQESGQSGTFEFVTDANEAIEGERYLKNDTDSGYLISQEGDGLNRYPEKGDVFEGYVNVVDAATFNHGQIVFGAEESTDRNFYEVRVYPDDATFSVKVWVDGSDTALDSESVSLSFGEWYRIEVEWHDGSAGESDNEIVCRLYDDQDNEIASVQANDDTFSDESGFGFGHSGSSDETRFDAANVTSSV